MDDAPISREHPALGFCHDVAHGRDAILQLYEAANVIVTKPVKGSLLKSWAMRLSLRAGMRKAKVALERKLAVVLHRMLADDTEFLADKAATAAA
jgi:hypothetical protein